MAIANRNYADLTANGTSDWVPVKQPGTVITVDCVDADGESAAWGSVNATLVYSPDGKMLATLEDESGDAITGTDGFAHVLVPTGYVGVVATGISGETLRVKVQQSSVTDGVSGSFVR